MDSFRLISTPLSDPFSVACDADLTTTQKKFGELWREMSDEDKEPYHGKAKTDRQRYLKDMAQARTERAEGGTPGAAGKEPGDEEDEEDAGEIQTQSPPQYVYRRCLTEMVVWLQRRLRARWRLLLLRPTGRVGERLLVRARLRLRVCSRARDAGRSARSAGRRTEEERRLRLRRGLLGTKKKRNRRSSTRCDLEPLAVSCFVVFSVPRSFVAVLRCCCCVLLGGRFCSWSSSGRDTVSAPSLSVSLCVSGFGLMR